MSPQRDTLSALWAALEAALPRNHLTGVAYNSLNGPFNRPDGSTESPISRQSN